MDSAMSIGDLGKALGNQWKEMSEEDKAPFFALQQKRQKAYSKEMEKYRKTKAYKDHQNTMHAWKIHVTRKPFRKDENAPTRPLTPYILYSNSVREKVAEDLKEENPDFKITDVMRECGRLWGTLDDSARKVWGDKALVLRKAYDKKLEKYRKTKQYLEYAAELEEYKAGNKEKRRRLLGIPKKKKKTKRARERSETEDDSEEPRKKKRKANKSKRGKSPKSRKGKSDKKKKADKKKSKSKKSKRSPSPKRKKSKKGSSRSSRSPSSSAPRSRKSKSKKGSKSSKKSKSKGKKK